MGSMDKKPDGVDTDPGTDHRPPYRRSSAWAAALITSLAWTGGQSAMTDPAHSSEPSDGVTPAGRNEPSGGMVAVWPLRFGAHQFDASCYSTYGCKVKYGNYRRIDSDDELKLSSASIGDKYPGNLSAGWGPIRNFPPPALVTWRYCAYLCSFMRAIRTSASTLPCRMAPATACTRTRLRTSASWREFVLRLGTSRIMASPTSPRSCRCLGIAAAIFATI
jgi:hypothetical protein